MKISSVKRMLTLYLVNHILSGTRFFAAKRWLLRHIGWVIGEGSYIVGPVFSSAVLQIGCHSWIGRELTVNGNGTVIIGDNCDIAPGVTFFTGGHQIGNQERRAGLGESYTIKIGDGTWLGGNCTVLGNTYVGSGCVIAACACVTESIPDNTLAGGVPARMIRSLCDEDLSSF